MATLGEMDSGSKGAGRLIEVKAIEEPSSGL